MLQFCQIIRLYIKVLFLLFLEKSRQKSVAFAIVRTMLYAPCFANMGAYAFAQKVRMQQNLNEMSKK